MKINVILIFVAFCFISKRSSSQNYMIERSFAKSDTIENGIFKDVVFVVDSSLNVMTIIKKTLYLGLECDIFLETYDISKFPSILTKSVSINKGNNIRDLKGLSFEIKNEWVIVSWGYMCTKIEVSISKSKLLEYDLSELLQPIILESPKNTLCIEMFLPRSP